MSKLTKYKFSDLYSMASGISSTKEQAGHGSPFLSFSVVFNNYFVPDILNDLMDTSEKEKETYSIKTGDIFLTRTSEVIDELAMSCVAVKDYPNATFSGFLKRLRPTQDHITYPKFMAFYLRSPMFRKTITNNAVMTLRASLNEAIFSYLELLLPAYSEQKKAGDLLYLLNQKIALNNRINAELEAMAKTLYDYWFVQFDFPDANGKPYKTSGGKMVYNATLKREIPTAWRTIRLNELLQNCADATVSGALDSNVPYTPIDMLPMKKMSFGDAYPSERANTSLIKYKKNDILIGAMRVYFHRVCIAPFDGITRTTTLVLRPQKKDFLPYIYQVCNEEKTINIAAKISVGTQQPYVNWENSLENLTIAYPEDDALIQRYSSAIGGIVKEVISREKESAKLKELRDWLLPLLMNGQVTVK